MKLKKPLLIIAGLLLSWAVLAQDAVERVDPPFWWTGMEHKGLQLMMYGEDISSFTPAVNYPGVELKRVSTMENPNYLFVDLVITNEAKAGDMEIALKKDGEIAHTYSYELRARKEGSAKREGFNSSDVIYLVTPDRFANGNPDNDAVESMKEKPNRDKPGGRHGGDIQGLKDHMDYIADMGFTALWLNPLLENDMPSYSYHGYSTTDYYKTDPRYGSNEAYKEMVQLARNKGIKVIMDQIVNHIGSEHWWMDDLPSQDWVHNPDTFVRTNHKHMVHQDPYASAYDKKGMVDGWFVKTMPDLNQDNPFLAEYLIQNSIWWVEYAGLQGIRQDTYPYPDAGFMSRWTCRIMKEYPNFNIVGEEWNYNQGVVAYWQRGKADHDEYKSCLPSMMDFPVQGALIKALNEDQGGWERLYKALAKDFHYADPHNLVVIPDNHDMDRYYTQIGKDYDMYRNGLAFLFTIRGIPQLYYGTEFLEANPGNHNHGIIRSDFPGGWPGDEVNAFTGKGLKDTQKDAKAFVKKLLNWRQGKEVVHNGQLTHFAPFEGFYVYFRYNDDEKIMVVMNRNEADKALPLKRFSELLRNADTGTDVLSGESYKLDEAITVPAKTPLILEL